MKKTIIILAALFCLALPASAQRWSIGTNAVDWLDLGTINIEGSASVSQHFTLNVGGKYNPWTFRSGDPEKQFENKKRELFAGFRYWPWYVYSGWWIGLDAQWQEYNRGGIFKRETEEGDAIGAALSLGYTLILQKSWNLEFGAGLWAGQTKYRRYTCPMCGNITDEGKKFFILPNDVMISLVYVF